MLKPQPQMLIHPAALRTARAYQLALAAGTRSAGADLQSRLAGLDLAQLPIETFLELLVQTKRPQIFAESAVHGDGRDWSAIELSILGDLSIAVPVTVYDDGRHHAPQVHAQPFAATLLYVPGALLRNGFGKTPADWAAVTRAGQIDPEGYYALYERRLLPALRYADQVAGASGQQALLTIPGLGCGQFAGPFHGQLGEHLRRALLRLLETHHAQLAHLRAVYYDPYQECQNERHQIGTLTFLVRPLTQGNQAKPQLCRPEAYAEPGDDFSHCRLFSVVAWDHVSWPGNDFYIGNRATDDGVKAAATSSMAVMTGVAGIYDPHSYTYNPPPGYRNWEAVVQALGLQLQVSGNLGMPHKSEGAQNSGPE